MRKFLTVTALLSLFATASAQTINATDTKGTGADADQVERDTTTASVTQTVNLKLPEATALHQHYAARAGLPVTPPVPARRPRTPASRCPAGTPHAQRLPRGPGRQHAGGHAQGLPGFGPDPGPAVRAAARRNLAHAGSHRPAAELHD